MTQTSEPSGPQDGLAISVRGLRRTYGRGPTAFEAVRGLDLDVAENSITALLGTNGAGKTSSLEVIEGLAPASGGEVRVLGLHPVRDRAQVRRRTGVLLQESGFSHDLTVRETLELFAGLATDPLPIADPLARLDLDDKVDTPVRGLSGGQLRRLDLACTLLGQPDLLILDEPTTGMDPESRAGVWELLRDLRAGGATILVTTHYLEEAESLADHISIMHRGRVVRAGTPAELMADHAATISFRTPDTALPTLTGVRVERAGTHTQLAAADLQPALTALLTWAERENVVLDELHARPATLETVFLEIARGGGAADDEPSDHALEGALR